MTIRLRTLCLVTAILCNVQQSLEHEIPRRSFLSRRAIDGSRGRKYFDPNEEGAFDSYGSAGGQYEPYDDVTDLSDIRKNVPGEPGVDYPAYSTLPQTGFTCEGRSRGYYADEAAGCQVFHVCHDVLVSSFLCPIGSTFSQKLLTCDWWTKVDCSATRRYLEVNRNNYQIDDDEMIRNAYAMISLQSAEDVTKDGLVDPDSGARIISYSTLGGRTASYTPGTFRRITDYPAVDATGNDLPSSFEDYPQRDERPPILDYNRYQEKIARANSAYHQDKFHLEDKARSPYHAAPIIIRHDYQGRSTVDNEFQDEYRRPDGFTNRLQASYAPTVPTVTTTTRRLYSPTVPTTYRSSTLAYSKLDLLMDSSDHLYAHSKSLVTPPTFTRQNDDEAKKSGTDSPVKTDGNDQKNDEVRLNFEEKSKPTFRINVTDTIDEDEVFRQQNDRPVVRNNEDESAEDIETRDSIGIARALNDAREKITVQRQDPVIQVLKSERADLTTLSPLQRTSADRFAESYDHTDSMSPTQTTLKKLNDILINKTSDEESTEDYEDIVNSSTTRSPERTAYTRSFGDRTTPLVTSGNLRRRGDDDSTRLESIVPVTVRPVADTTEKIVQKIQNEPADRFSSFNESQTTADQNSSSTKSLPSLNDESTLTDLDYEVPRPALFLQPPVARFLINIPEETSYTTIGNSFKSFWSHPGLTTTEIPRFSSAPPSGSDQNENVDEQELIDYADEGSATLGLKVHTTTGRATFETSTPSPWLVPSWLHDRSLVSVPVTDIVPPIVDYNDGFGDFIPPDKDSDEYHTAFDRVDHAKSSREQSNISASNPRNNSETEILNQYNTGFQFTIRDAIKAQAESKMDRKSPSSVIPRISVSISSGEEKAISIDTEVTTSTPEKLISSSSTRSPEKPVTPVSVDRSSISITRSSVAVNGDNDTEEPILKAVTPRNVLPTEKPEEKIEETVEATTTSSPPHPIRPGSLKQIEEAIDQQNSPYEVTVKKNENLDTTADDFISRLIAQHELQPTVSLNDQLSDFEIVKSFEPQEEVTFISQTPELPDDTSHIFLNENNGSSLVSSNDTAGQSKESNVSMLSLIQLMAELLKLDRLPRPFSSVKDLRNTELETPTHLDLDHLDQSPFVTADPPLDYSQAKTNHFGNIISRATLFDILNIPVEPETTTLSVDQNEPLLVTTSAPLDHSQIRTSFRNAKSKALAFNTLRTTKADTNSEPKTTPNPDENESLTFPTPPLSDQSVQVRTPLKNANSKASIFDDTLRTTSNVAFTLSPDVSLQVNSEETTETETRPSRTNGRANRTFQKQEILEQLAENFGQPLYRSDSVRRSLVFDLPQVKRNLDFETGQPIRKSEPDVIEEVEEDPESSTTRTTTTTTTTTMPTTSMPTTSTTTTTQRAITTAESERTIVETEFVPSIGFSFDTDEGREEYVEAVLGGLIDDQDDVVAAAGKNESSVAQLTHEAPKNETLRAERREKNSEDV